MAKANQIERTETVLVEQKVTKNKIILELTEKEARALLFVCNQIGGATTGPRGVFSGTENSIDAALEKVLDPCKVDIFGLNHTNYFFNTIHFSEQTYKRD